MRTKLQCETNTSDMAMRVMRAGEKRFPCCVLDAVFEHGQWWLICIDRKFSVVDAEGGNSVDGFDFEEV